MKRLFGRKRKLRNRFTMKNWETDIAAVQVEPCDPKEDPLGYRAVFQLDRDEHASEAKDNTFSIGASLLAKREENLFRAGYRAPMTLKALTMIEKLKSDEDSPLELYDLVDA